jgi:membrane protein DedA with SNARE-associated domain
MSLPDLLAAAGNSKPLPGVFQHFEAALRDWGYLAVGGLVFVEDFGVPVPGETMLIAASLYAGTGRLNIVLVALVGFAAAVLGDNLGYAVGRWGGRPLLERYRRVFRLQPATLHRGERLFARYGSVTIFFARFIVGLRVLAGPLAGALKMHWPRFGVFNALGALTWVTVIASVSYAFGRRLPALVHTLRTANVAILAAAILLAVFFGKRLLARLGPDE